MLAMRLAGGAIGVAISGITVGAGMLMAMVGGGRATAAMAIVAGLINAFVPGDAEAWGTTTPGSPIGAAGMAVPPSCGMASPGGARPWKIVNTEAVSHSCSVGVCYIANCHQASLSETLYSAP